MSEQESGPYREPAARPSEDDRWWQVFCAAVSGIAQHHGYAGNTMSMPSPGEVCSFARNVANAAMKERR